MTETLQQKIDDIINQDECPGCYEYRCLITIAPDLDKALQEFREQINDLKFDISNCGVDERYRIGYDTACISILALLGDKK